MSHQTKNIITRESIEKELREDNRLCVRSSVILCVVMAVIFVPLTIGFVMSVSNICQRLIQNILVEILACVLVGAIGLAPVYINLWGLRGDLIRQKLLKQGDFDIVVESVLYKSTKIVRRHEEEFLHFKAFGAVNASHTHFQLASTGDDFYIIYYRQIKKVAVIYPCKMYEYMENEA